MTKQTEAMKLALEALDGSIAITMAKIALRNKAITALREALAEQPAQQEPVAYMVKAHGMLQRLSRRADVADELACQYRKDDPSAEVLPLYTSPPAQRKPLTPLEIENLRDEHLYSVQGVIQGHEAFTRAIEAKPKEKNNGD